MKSVKKVIIKQVALISAIVITGLLVWLPVQSHGQDTIQTSLQWLSSIQHPEGFWGDITEPSILDTITVVDTFQAINPSDPAYASAIEWLKTFDPVVYDYDSGVYITLGPENYDYSSRRLYTFSMAIQDISFDLDFLLAGRQVNGGWGLNVDHESDVLDTSLALRALAMAGGVDATVITGAVSYLLASQNPDGGWGFVSGQASHVYYTAVVMQALEMQSQSTEIANALSRATAYVVGQQSSDGSWGNVPDTALAFMAIVKTTGDVTARTSAIQFLLGQQQANGSWNDDPYSTALALQALKASEPLQGDLDQDGDGYTPRQGDCNDANATIYPGAPDLTADGVDQNCDGIDGPPQGVFDNDHDGYTPQQGDCNDVDPAIFPGAADVPGNGIDENCDGRDGVLAVAIQALALYKVIGTQEVPATTFGPYETMAIHVSANDPAATFSLFVTDPAGGVLPLGTGPGPFGFNTQNNPAGSYVVTAWAVDPGTGVVMDQARASFTIQGGVGVSGGILAVIPGFTHAGATENVTLAASLYNGSNMAGSLTVVHEIKTPSGALIHSGTTTVAVSPSAAASDATLAAFTHTFAESGEYPVTASIYNGQTLLTTLTGAISAAPLVRIDPSLTITPGEVLPDGDKRIHIDIRLEGVEQTP